MGFLLTLLYFGLSSLSPDYFMPDLGPYRPLMLIGITAVLASVPSLLSNANSILRQPQLYLMTGLIGAVAISRLAHLWFGGALASLDEFITTGIVFYLVLVNVTTVRRLKLLVAFTAVLALCMCANALWSYHFGPPGNPFTLPGTIVDPASHEIIDVARLRYVGSFGDPNDFAQLMLVVLPFVALLWKPKNVLPSILRVMPLVIFLVYSIYRTNSRGAFLAFAVLVLLSFRKRLGIVATSLASGLAFLAAFMISAASARDLSMQEGSAAGRIKTWGAGLAMLRSSPIFGVGFGGFLDNNDTAYLTAHNSFVLCFAELGLFGYFFWLGLIVYTLFALNRLLKSPATTPAGQDLYRYLSAIRLSLVMFVATSFFLSRTYAMTFYLLIAAGVAAVRLYGTLGEPESPQVSQGPLVLWTAGLEVASVILIYAMVRIRSAG